ncbi:MAG TPA: hypothetical protein DEA22_06020, partial [Blastocatellia bacterium]|nr:hypothetical protein [Blastocatellia bacterium]
MAILSRRLENHGPGITFIPMATALAENLAGFEDLPLTIPHFCIQSFRINNKPDALSFKVDGVWKRLSGSEAVESIRKIAIGFWNMGVRAGDRVAIMSENRPEWSLTDLALLSLRAVIVPIYTTQAVEQIRYILEDSGSKMLLISGERLYKHARSAIQSVECLERIVFFDKDSKFDGEKRAVSLAEVEHFAEAAGDITDFDELLEQVESDDLATIIYTSGTTGEPKGVMLS